MKKLTLVGILALLASCDSVGSHAVDANRDRGTGAAGMGAAGAGAAGSSAGGGTAGAAAGTNGGLDAAAGTGTDASSGTDAQDAPTGGDATDATSPGSDAAKDAPAGSDASDATKDDAGADKTGGDSNTSDGGTGDAGAEAGKDADDPETVANCGRLKCNCTFEGKKLAGKVKYVTTIPYDFTVNVVTNFLPDLYVVEIPSPGIANRCGQWQPEENLPDLRVMKVTNGHGDFSIQDVTSPTLPGLPSMRGGP
jgi:hypothetical protein